MGRAPRGARPQKSGLAAAIPDVGWTLPPLVPQDVTRAHQSLPTLPEPARAKPRRILPWKHRQQMATDLNLTESEMRARSVLDSPNYRCRNMLPRAFKLMRESFKRDGVVDADACRRARAWITSRRNKRNEATLYYDEIWNELVVVAKHVKSIHHDEDRARETYHVYADSMATVIEPLLVDNRDKLTKHDYGGPLSNANTGCVEAAWKGETPYT